MLNLEHLGVTLLHVPRQVIKLPLFGIEDLRVHILKIRVVLHPHEPQQCGIATPLAQIHLDNIVDRHLIRSQRTIAQDGLLSTCEHDLPFGVA